MASIEILASNLKRTRHVHPFDVVADEKMDLKFSHYVFMNVVTDTFASLSAFFCWFLF
jgi:hypothetical protein